MRTNAKTQFALLLALLVATYCASGASASSITFDFEDGTQGWDLSDAFWSDFDGLGGQKAIHGVDLGEMSAVFDLTDISTITVDFYFTASDPQLSPQALGLLLVGVDSNGTPIPGTRDFRGSGASLLATPGSPLPNPDRRWWNVGDALGTFEVSILWNAPACTPENPGPCFVPRYSGFVDNVALSVPEASLQLLSLMALLFGKSRLRSDAAG